MLLIDSLERPKHDADFHYLRLEGRYSCLQSNGLHIAGVEAHLLFDHFLLRRMMASAAYMSSSPISLPRMEDRTH